jgi:hippurate hydrolase
MPDDTAALLKAWQPEMAAIRRDIHAHPELGMEEVRTAALVAGRLRAWGIAVTEGVGRTGVVGTLRGSRPGQRAIGLRADMDALAIPEATGLPYASTNAGIMHACGHDGHTTMLLGAARALAAAPDFAGTVHLIFQPAEEGRGGGGAAAMLADGLFERFPCEAVYGLHNMPGLPVGAFAIRKGAFLATTGRWTVRFRGPGGHGGAAPHLTPDLSVAAAHFILGLQTIVGRNVPPLETAVLSLGHIAGGDINSFNVMPAEILLVGTGRCFSDAVRDLLARRMEELAKGLAALHGATAEVEARWDTLALFNHDAQTDVAVAAARALPGAQVDADAPALTGGEDFSLMLRARPGAFMFLGNGPKGGALHTPQYDFNDEIIPIGAAYWVSIVGQELG